jgi:phosphocarrier protein
MFGRSATRRIVVSRPEGLHARPCLAICRTAQQFQSRIELRRGRQKADARSVLELLSLGAGLGTELVLKARGADSEQALDALVELFGNNFGLASEVE